MFKYEEHVKMANRLGTMDSMMSELCGEVLGAYGKSSSAYKSSVVAEKRIGRVRERLEKIYLKERKKFLVQIPKDLWKSFPEDVYRVTGGGLGSDTTNSE